jgi:hypothetical protein
MCLCPEIVPGNSFKGSDLLGRLNHGVLAGLTIRATMLFPAYVRRKRGLPELATSDET